MLQEEVDNQKGRLLTRAPEQRKTQMSLSPFHAQNLFT